MPGVAHGADDHRRRRLPRQRSTQAQVLRRDRAARGAHLLARRGWCEALVTLDPLAAFRGNYSQRDVMQRDPRAACGSSRDLRVGVRNLQSFNIGGGNREIDFAIRGPELEQLAEYAEQLREQAPELGHRRRRHDAQAEQAGAARRRSTARAPPTSASDTQDVAAALRLMVGGDQEVTRFRDRADRRGLRRRSCGSIDEDRSDPDTISRLYVPRSNGELVRLDIVVALEEGAEPVARRPPRSAAPGERARRRRARLRAGRPPRRRCASAAAELNMPAGYTHRGQRPRPRARAHLPRVRLGVPAVDRLHVHDPGGAVREPAQPVHHPAVAAAVAALRAAVALPDRQHAEPVLGARHAGAVRRRRRRTRSCRSTTRSTCARQGMRARRRRSSRPTATGCGRS